LNRYTNLPGELLRNLLLGVRAALLWPVSLERVAAGWLHIVCALALSLLPWFVAQRIDVGVDGEFSTLGLPGIWFPFVLIVIAATLAARLLRCGERTGQLLVALLNANIAIDVAVCALPFVTIADSERYIDRFGSDLAGYWLGLSVAVLVLRLHGWRHVSGWLVAIVAGPLVALAVNNVWQTTTLWTESYDDQQVAAVADSEPALDEDVLYQQPRLLNEQLQRLQPGTPGETNLYFLGVAGDSAQKVFLREIRSIYQIMLDRFASREHSLLLINNAETLLFEPIATVTSIQAAARRFAEVMDRDNDILFIYLTSHGSREDGFELDLPPLRLKELAPAELRRILDEVGIRWRVIVVSACYSGIFIKPLEDDHTLVITAAAADRTSFGCADENDYTYFGRAYFEQALAKTNSFVEAFALARGIVTDREKAEGETPSLPQISIGRHMAEKLNELQRGMPAKKETP
jgi:hypothetical protein